MTKHLLDVSAIHVGADGAVVLDDATLRSMVDDAGITSAGGDWEYNTSTCTNTSHCNGSTNGLCSNAQGHCENTSNTECMITIG